MAEEIQELVVSVTPEGVSETTNELQRQREEFTETADVVGDEAGRLESFSGRWQGAATIFSATVLTLSAALATQIPVLGETIGAFNALLTAVGLKIDSVIRPALSGFNTSLFELSDAILQTQGPLGKAIGILGTLAVVGGVVAGALGLIGAVAPAVASGIGIIAGAVSAAVGVLGVVAGLISGPVILALLAVAAVVGAAFLAWKTNFLGIRDITQSVINFLAPFINDFLSAVFEGRWFDALGAMVRFSGSVIFRLIEMFDKFKATVRTIFEVLGAVVVSALKRLGNGAVAALESAVNAAIGLIPDRIRSDLGISTVSMARPFAPQSAGQIGAAAGGRLRRRFAAAESRRRGRQSDLEQQLAQTIQALQGTNITHETNLDGRMVAQSTKKLLGNDAANVGRVNRSR